MTDPDRQEGGEAMNGRPFTERELAMIRKLYPDKANITVDQIGERLGRNATSISKAAARLGLEIRRKREKRTAKDTAPAGDE